MPIVEPAAPENVELNVDATQVIIAWNAPSSWLPLRRHQRQVLDSNATDKRPACTETGDDEFCYPAAVTRPAGRTAPEYATSAKRRRQAPQPSGSPGVSPGPGQHPACLRLSQDLHHAMARSARIFKIRAPGDWKRSGCRLRTILRRCSKLIDGKARERYLRALRRLTPRERRLIVGRAELGYSFKQLALIDDRASADAARKALRRAVVRLSMEMDT